MPRPKNPRTIHAPPTVGGFKPRQVGEKGEVTLSLEEFEAIRLIDFEGLDQIRASKLMGVSRQTFGRVLRSGRFTLSKALIKGLHLKVSGGCYEIRGDHGKQDNTGGRHRHRRGAMAAPEDTQITSGGNIMSENNNTDGQNRKTPPSGNDTEQGNGGGQGQGRGTGQGQRQGRGLGGGKGDGSCRKKDGGRGRGMGGGKGNGSCGAR
ncbi:DUF134 domain-containing protein [Desulfocicer niacini]